MLENIDNITLEDIKGLHNAILANSQSSAIISAPVATDKKLFDTIANELSTLPQASKTFERIKPLELPDLSENKVVTITEDRNQAHIVQMFKINESGNVKDKAALMVLNQILGGDSNSRLFTDLREKQNIDTYRVGSSYNYNERGSELALEIMTTTQDKNNNIKQYQNIQKALDGFKKNINELISTSVSEKELQNAKLALKSRLVFATESNYDKHVLLGNYYGSAYGKNYVEELTNAIDNMSAIDIQKAAKIFLDKPSVTSILASKETIDANADYLKTVGTII